MNNFKKFSLFAGVFAVFLGSAVLAEENLDLQNSQDKTLQITKSISFEIGTFRYTTKYLRKDFSVNNKDAKTKPVVQNGTSFEHGLYDQNDIVFTYGARKSFDDSDFTLYGRLSARTFGFGADYGFTVANYRLFAGAALGIYHNYFLRDDKLNANFVGLRVGGEIPVNDKFSVFLGYRFAVAGSRDVLSVNTPFGEKIAKVKAADSLDYHERLNLSGQSHHVFFGFSF